MKGLCKSDQAKLVGPQHTNQIRYGNQGKDEIRTLKYPQGDKIVYYRTVMTGYFQEFQFWDNKNEPGLPITKIGRSHFLII